MIKKFFNFKLLVCILFSNLMCIPAYSEVKTPQDAKIYWEHPGENLHGERIQDADRDRRIKNPIRSSRKNKGKVKFSKK